MLQMNSNNGYYEYEYDTFHFLYVSWRVTTCNYCDPCVQIDLGTSLKEMHLASMFEGGGLGPLPFTLWPSVQAGLSRVHTIFGDFEGKLNHNSQRLLIFHGDSLVLMCFDIQNGIVMPYIPGWCLIVNIVDSSATVQAQVVRLMKERQWSRKEVPRTPPESLLLSIRMGYDAWQCCSCGMQHIYQTQCRGLTRFLSFGFCRFLLFTIYHQQRQGIHMFHFLEAWLDSNVS